MRDELKRIHKERAFELRELIRKKFAAANLGSDALAQALENSLAELLDRSGEVLVRMLENLHNHESQGDANSLFEVAVVFAPRDRQRMLASRNFFSIPAVNDDAWDAQNGPEGAPFVFFLSCPYPEMEKYLHREFMGESAGQKFTYKLAPWFGYVRAERDLHEAAALYGVERPAIFSPWSRRAVTLEVSGQVPDLSRADLRLAENGLDSVLLTSHVLMWNVSSATVKRWDKSYQSPDGLESNYVYEYAVPENRDQPGREASFILPEYADLGNPLNLPLMATKNGRKIVIESQSELAQEFKVLEIHQPLLTELPDDCQVFMNSCETGTVLARPRLRTAGDVNLVLSALKQGEFRCRFLGKSGGKPALARYVTGHKYAAGNAPKGLEEVQRQFPCRVAFTGNAPFLEDYAEYALSFLGRRYPEFLWIGEAGQ